APDSPRAARARRRAARAGAARARRVFPRPPSRPRPRPRPRRGRPRAGSSDALQVGDEFAQLVLGDARREALARLGPVWVEQLPPAAQGVAARPVTAAVGARP